MILRQATAADIPALVEAEAACFGAEAWTVGMIREEFTRAGGVQWIAESEGSAVGFAFGMVVVDEVHVLHIATMPDRRRGGIGRRLLGALLATPGVESAWLEVRADNPVAIGLYASEGFLEVGRRPRYYGGVDAVVMRQGGRT